jgi:hypothetical protein
MSNRVQRMGCCLVESLTVNIDGRSTIIERRKISLEKLVLDIENPRLRYHLDTRLNDSDVTQEKLEFALVESNDQYEKLRDHIEQNHGLFDPIWVAPEKASCLVIEGNTRAYIYKELSEKYPHDQEWQTIDSYILPEDVDRGKINFIRLIAHLFGTTPWGAYEKAAELYRLHTDEDYSYKRLEQLTKLSTTDIKNNIQAYQDMQEQFFPAYGAKPDRARKFSYFVEFRKNTELRKLVRQGKLNLIDFCDWVGQDKFRRGEDVRRLPLVLEDQEARQALIDDDFEAALDQLEQTNPTVKSGLFEKVDAVVHGLEHLPFTEYDEIKRGKQPAKVELLQRLQKTVNKFLENIGP